MLWTLEIVFSIFFGYQLVNFIAHDSLSITATLSIATVVGQYIFSWIVFLYSSFSHFEPYHGTFSSLIILFLGLFLYKQNAKYNSDHKISFRQTFHPIAIFSIISFSIFMTWIHDRAMMKENIITAGAGYGDFPFHLNIISSFTHGCNSRRRSPFDIVSVFYAGEPLAYPVMTNFYTASLMLTGGASQRMALLVPSLLVTYSLIHGIYNFSYYFTKSHYAAFISLFLFFNLGGMGFTVWHNKKFHASDYVFNWGNNYHGYWFHPIMHVLVPQRASLYSMPLCYWALFCLLRGIKEKNTKLMMIAGLLTALMPQFQIHSYAAIAQYSIIICLLTFPFKKYNKWTKFIKLWSCFGLIAVPLGVPQFYPFIHRLDKGTKTGKFLNFRFVSGKFMHSSNPLCFFRMWWDAIGIFGIVSLVFGLFCLNSEQFLYYTPALVVFIGCNVILYQPWECDNLKLLYAVWIPFALPVASQYFVVLLKKKKTFLLAIFLIFCATLSSMWHTKYAMSRVSRLFLPDDYNFGLFVAENTSPKSVFVSTKWHANPIGTVAGNQIFCGYGGWIISHGLEYRNRLHVNYMMGDNPNKVKLFNTHHVNYVFAHLDEWPAFQNMTNNKNWVRIWNTSYYKLFKRVAF